MGSLALKVVVAEEVAEMYSLGGCTLKATVLSDGELVEAGIEAGPALLAEFVLTLTVLYFAFSIALDPKQFQVRCIIYNFSVFLKHLHLPHIHAYCTCTIANV